MTAPFLIWKPDARGFSAKAHGHQRFAEHCKGLTYAEALTDVKVLIGATLLDVAEEEDTGLINGLRRDVGYIPCDCLLGAHGPRVAGNGRSELRAVDNVELRSGRREYGGGREHRGSGSGDDGEGGDELGSGEHVDVGGRVRVRAAGIG